MSTMQFEADHGTLEAALSVQQRRREAVGERPGDAVRLPLLKYRHMGIWPTATPGQQRHFEAVLGERPSPATDSQPGAALCPSHTPPVSCIGLSSLVPFVLIVTSRQEVSTVHCPLPCPGR